MIHLPLPDGRKLVLNDRLKQLYKPLSRTCRPNLRSWRFMMMSFQALRRTMSGIIELQKLIICKKSKKDSISYLTNPCPFQARIRRPQSSTLLFDFYGRIEEKTELSTYPVQQKELCSESLQSVLIGAIIRTSFKNAPDEFFKGNSPQTMMGLLQLINCVSAYNREEEHSLEFISESQAYYYASLNFEGGDYPTEGKTDERPRRPKGSSSWGFCVKFTKGHYI
ncbi:hypothetical protein HNY73_015318 [Argiope bruennichi]|uniref:Uncharacterized protein n=1 Tax=Argiope bruennichi TaxID=94029 RepID=A0A8T0EWF0_ARGBR|nr:hypothetical protein HNY73_015318 [Argiope bruennichi]